MQKTKRFKLGLAAIFAAIVLALSALLVPLTSVAYADDGEETRYQKLYYFSDDEHCKDYYDYMVNSYGFSKDDIELIYVPSESFIDWYAGDTDRFPNISNSLVIFEAVNQPVFRYVYNLIESGYLKTFFKRLKTAGCKIMYLTNVDEALYVDLIGGEDDESLDSYLDYVDIQIDLDMYTAYIDNTIQYIEEYLDKVHSDIYKFTLIVNDYIYYSENFYLYIWAYYYDLIQDYYVNEDEDRTIFHTLNKAGIQIIHYDSHDFIDNTFDKAEDNRSDDYLDLVYNEYYFLACSYYSAEEFNDWINKFDCDLEVRKQCFFIDFLNVLDSDDDFRSYMEENVYYYFCGAFVYFYSDIECGEGFYNFKDVLDAFIFGWDLSIFNNFESRCEVCYFPILSGGPFCGIRRTRPINCTKIDIDDIY